MSTDEYVPSEGDARKAYVSGRDPMSVVFGDDPDPDSNAEFDRFLARVRRDAKAEAWDECVDEAEGAGWIHDYAVREMHDRNPYRETGGSDERR